jgi:fructose-1,6-bisphosphatase/sedoheptulose 1,7-bisphosphatase-like protein
MKTQNYNQGELAELKVNIEKQLTEDLKTMSENSGLSVDDLVAVAVKRFRSSHADYMGIDLDFP